MQSPSVNGRMDDVDERAVHALLERAGDAWRSGQSFDEIQITPARLRASRFGLSWGSTLRWVASVVAAAGLVTLAIWAIPRAPSNNVAADATFSFVPTTTTASPAAGATVPEDVEQVRLDVIAAVKGDTTNFGGVYLDEDNVLVIQYVGSNVGRPAVDDQLRPGVDVRWEKVERSRDDLMRILREVRELDLDGVWAVSIDTVSNQVQVFVSPDRFQEVSRTLSATQGNSVLVLAAAPGVIH
jgi:hypothetical protein